VSAFRVVPLAFVIVAGALAPPPALAVQATTPEVAGQGFSVTPPTMEIIGSPGEVVKRPLVVENPADRAQPAEFEFKNFAADGEDGRPSFTTDVTDYPLASWMSVNTNRVLVGPKQVVGAEITVRIPKDAPPGGHYGAILVRTVVPVNPGESAVAVLPEVASLVLLRVSGETHENLAVESFGSTKKLFKSGPIPYEVRMRNTGNVHVRTSGKVVVKDVLGRRVDQVDLVEATVLPSSVRRFPAQVKGKWFFGPHRATATMTYGTSRGTVTASTTTWFINLRAVAIASAIVMLALILYLLGRRSARPKRGENAGKHAR